jgi:D-3-phosphoglycerate dehydrogenase / 2-oxoglutarate reductase
VNLPDRRPKLVIIGDRFLSPAVFEAAIRTACGDVLDIATIELPWPDEPMRHGYGEPGMEGLKEYQGDADAIVRWVAERRS